MKLIAPQLRALSIFLNNGMAFLVLFIVVAGIKLAFSALVPASYELQSFPVSGFSASPWVALENGLFEAWKMLTGSNVSYAAWSTTTPPAMQGDLRLLSLFLRLPGFICDILMSAALYFTVCKITVSRESARLTSLIWFMNPFTLFAVELIGVPDILVALLTLVSLLCLLRQKPILSVIILFCAIGLKLYPILILPALLLYLHKYSPEKRLQELWMTLCGPLGVVAYLIWFSQGASLTVAEFTNYTPISQPLSLLGIFSSSVPLSVAMAALVVVYFLALYFGEDSNPSGYIIHLVTVVLLTYFVFSEFHAQYFIWVLPFITLDVALFGRRRLLLLVVFQLSVFLAWFITSAGLATPSGYSLLLFPIEGTGLPAYSIAIQQFLRSDVTEFILAGLIQDTMYAFALVYVLAVVSHWNWRRRARDYESG